MLAVSPAGLLTLRRRVWAKCQIELQEPLHLGAGKDPTSPIDLIVMRDSLGRPIIPGSSLKGFFRSFLARTLLGLKAAGIHSLQVGSETVDLSGCIDSVAEDPKERMGLKGSIGELCLLDKLFGFAGKKVSLSSRVRFTDAIPSRDAGTFVRTHVSIDRERDAAERGMLVHMEAVREHAGEESTKFTFTMIFDEVSDPNFSHSNLIFYKLLELLSKGIEDFVGGWKSRGYGHVRIGLEEIEVAEISDLIEGRRVKKDLQALLGEVKAVGSG